MTANDAASPPTDRPPAPRTRPGVHILTWLLFLSLATITQIAFKWGGTDLEGLDFGQAWFDALTKSPAVGIAFAGYIAMFVVWLQILKRTPLSKAFVMTGLVYITVPAAAYVIFGEKIGLGHAAGIALIMVGIAVMGSPEGEETPPH